MAFTQSVSSWSEIETGIILGVLKLPKNCQNFRRLAKLCDDMAQFQIDRRFAEPQRFCKNIKENVVFGN